MEPVRVVLVHREQPERCIRTAHAFLAQDVDVDLTIVDNGSSSVALEALRAALPDVEILELGENTGFGPGANAGLRKWLDEGDGEWCALAPHDALPEPGAVRALVEAAMARARAGLACAEFGEPLRPVLDPYFGGIQLPRQRAEDGWEDAGYPHGTLMLLGRRCLEDIGLFDERYFAYCEEAELGARARARGWEVGIVWGARVDNPSISSNAVLNDYLMMRNTLLLVREQSGRYKVTVRFLMALYQTAFWAFSSRKRPPIFSARGRFLGMRDFLRRRYGPPPTLLG